jgi:hypothetical protein
MNDHISIIRVLAKLLSHRVDMESPLYSLSDRSLNQNQILDETITLGSQKSDDIFLGKNKQEILPEKFYNPSISPPSQQYELLEFSQARPTYSLNKNSVLAEDKRFMSNLIAGDDKASSVLLKDRPSADLSVKPKASLPKLSHNVGVGHTISPQEDEIFSAQERDCENDHTVDKQPLENLRTAQYQKLIYNAFYMAQNHSNVLEMRQQSLHQISVIIQQQLNLYQKIFNAESH